MGQAITIGLAIAKSVFQVYGVDESGAVVVRRQVRRAQLLAFFAKLPACLIGIEACATAHHWARELTKLGHQVRLMPPSYVKPYVKRQKNDAADAEAICEAVTRPTMRFVEVKLSADHLVALDAAFPRTERAAPPGNALKQGPGCSPAGSGAIVSLRARGIIVSGRDSP